MNDVFRKLKLLKNEDIIWLIYFFIIIVSLISNESERKYIFTNNKTYQSFTNKINTSVLIIAFFIYLYYVIVAFNNLEYIKDNSNNKEIRLAFERLITSIIFLVGGIYAIYVDYDENSSSIDLGIF